VVVSTCRLDDEVNKLWVVTTCFRESNMDVFVVIA
jgi:hypothetical protein